jgi:hypothetical protein
VHGGLEHRVIAVALLDPRRKLAAGGGEISPPLLGCAQRVVGQVVDVAERPVEGE